MFKSHLISLVLFSGIVSVLMAFIKFDENKAIRRYAVKYFIYMVGGVILGSWIMRFL
jgi:hypothetical protein